MSRPRTESAFPNPFSPMTGGGSEGMDLRDYFAAKAMQVIINQTVLNEMTDYTVRAVAQNAYIMADAMLEERNKT